MIKQTASKPFIFFFDVDGTLYDHFDGIQPSAIRTLHTLRDAGHLVCLNTGRAKSFIPDSLTAFPFDGIVAGSGTYVEYQGRLLQEVTFSRPFVQYIYKSFTSHQIPFTLESSCSNHMNALMAEHTLLRFTSVRPKQEVSQSIRHGNDKFLIEDTMSAEAALLPIHKISFYAKEQTLPFLMQELGDKATVTLEKPDAHGYLYTEAIPAGCCKSNGAALLCSYAGIAYDRAVAVGDGSNDIDMIRWADTGIAMGNANTELKELADFICLPISEGGICTIPDYVDSILDKSTY